MAGNHHQRRRAPIFVLVGALAAAALVVLQPADDGTNLRYSADPAAKAATLRAEADAPLAYNALVSSARGMLVEFDAGVERSKRDANQRLIAGAIGRVEVDRALAEAQVAEERALAATAAEVVAEAASTTAVAESSTTKPSSTSQPSGATTSSSTVDTSTTAGAAGPKSGTLLPIVPPLPGETIVATTSAPTTTSTEAPTTTTAVPVIASKTPIAASGSLTGLRSGPSRPALAVKIDNSAAARPQTGINQADVVMEELVEFGLTRLIAIFHSTDPTTVGPVRSARTSDIHLLSNLNQPLLGYSGANSGVLKQLKASDLTLAGAPNLASGYSRSSARKAPHNLFASPAKLRSKIGGAGDTPAMFAYRPNGSAAINGARPVSGTSIKFGTDTVAYTWNGVGWIRTIGGRPHTDSTGKVVAPENVVVKFTNYRQSVIDARSPEAIAVGSGAVWVFTDGKLIEGTWSQASPTAPTRYADSSGDPILLTPGRTWVALPKPGTAKTF